MAETNNNNTGDAPQGELRYCHYTDDSQMPPIMRLMEADLSEPYSVYTYQYFIHNWPKLCWLVRDSRIVYFLEFNSNTFLWWLRSRQLNTLKNYKIIFINF
jgi:hypothetical protein